MGYGVFGKLPQKRDFVAQSIPRNVLEPLETWLQSAVAASRSELGAAWPDHYLVAPIWRFWIGAEIFGTGCAGALMPSVDGIGRFFPLAILYCSDAPDQIAPPPFAPLEAWYGAIEARLLTVLDEKAKAGIDTLTEGLEPPPAEPDAAEPPVQIKRGNVWQGEPGKAADVLTALALADYRSMLSHRSFWWTNGGASTGALLYARNALPDPFFFTEMIKGRVG